MTLWAVAKLFESLRYSAWAHGFVHFGRLIKDGNHSVYLASASYNFTEQFSHITAKRVWGKNMQLHVKLDLQAIGKSSFSFVCTVFDAETGTQLTSAYLTFVYVSFATRKPTPFPDWFNQWKGSLALAAPRPRLATPSVPVNAFRFEVKASFSDIDNNGHVNNSIFVKWSTDAGAEAALSGAYKDFKTDLGVYPLSGMEVKYIGEGSVDDVFTISTWQDEVQPNTIHFVFTRAGKVVTVVKLTFLSTEEQFKVTPQSIL